MADRHASSSDRYLCLTDLLDQDLSSYEWFYAQPKAVQQKLREADPSSFEEMQAAASAFS